MVIHNTCTQFHKCGRSLHFSALSVLWEHVVNLFHKLFFIPVEPSVLTKRTVGLHREGGAREAGRDRGGEVGRGGKGRKGGVGGRGVGGRGGGGGGGGDRGGDRGGGEDRGEGGDRGGDKGGGEGGGTRRECGLCILLLTVILVFISIGGMCELTRVMWTVLQ